jgi:hypothetical protein
MQSFQQWIEANHPDANLEEGIWDTAKNVGKKAAIGAALVGSGIGAANYMNNKAQPDRMNKNIANQSVTSDDAGSYFKMKKKMKKS